MGVIEVYIYTLKPQSRKRTTVQGIEKYLKKACFSTPKKMKLDLNSIVHEAIA